MRYTRVTARMNWIREISTPPRHTLSFSELATGPGNGGIPSTPRGKSADADSRHPAIPGLPADLQESGTRRVTSSEWRGGSSADDSRARTCSSRAARDVAQLVACDGVARSAAAYFGSGAGSVMSL